MVGTAWGGAQDADIVALLIDARKGLEEDDEAILRGLGDVRSAKKVLVLNKVDLVAKPTLLAAGAIAQRARGVRRDVHDFGAVRRRRRRPQELVCRECPAGSVALS